MIDSQNAIDYYIGVSTAFFKTTRLTPSPKRTLPLPPTLSHQIVHFVGFDELCLATSTRMSGSVCGRMLSHKTRTWTPTYPTFKENFGEDIFFPSSQWQIYLSPKESDQSFYSPPMCVQSIGMKSIFSMIKWHNELWDNLVRNIS